MDYGLKGKNALITGSTKGLGEAIARILAGLCGNRNRPESTGAAAGPDPDTRHEYMFTIYNCIPAISGTAGRQPQHSGSSSSDGLCLSRPLIRPL